MNTLKTTLSKLSPRPSPKSSLTPRSIKYRDNTELFNKCYDVLTSIVNDLYKQDLQKFDNKQTTSQYEYEIIHDVLYYFLDALEKKNRQDKQFDKLAVISQADTLESKKKIIDENITLFRKLFNTKNVRTLEQKVEKYDEFMRNMEKLKQGMRHLFENRNEEYNTLKLFLLKSAPTKNEVQNLYSSQSPNNAVIELLELQEQRSKDTTKIIDTIQRIINDHVISRSDLERLSGDSKSSSQDEHTDVILSNLTALTDNDLTRFKHFIRPFVKRQDGSGSSEFVFTHDNLDMLTQHDLTLMRDAMRLFLAQIKSAPRVLDRLRSNSKPITSDEIDTLKSKYNIVNEPKNLLQILTMKNLFSGYDKQDETFKKKVYDAFIHFVKLIHKHFKIDLGSETLAREKFLKIGIGMYKYEPTRLSYDQIVFQLKKLFNTKLKTNFKLPDFKHVRKNMKFTKLFFGEQVQNFQNDETYVLMELLLSLDEDYLNLDMEDKEATLCSAIVSFAETCRDFFIGISTDAEKTKQNIYLSTGLVLDKWGKCLPETEKSLSQKFFNEMKSKVNDFYQVLKGTPPSSPKNTPSKTIPKSSFDLPVSIDTAALEPIGQGCKKVFFDSIQKMLEHEKIRLSDDQIQELVSVLCKNLQAQFTSCMKNDAMFENFIANDLYTKFDDNKTLMEHLKLLGDKIEKLQKDAEYKSQLNELFQCACTGFGQMEAPPSDEESEVKEPVSDTEIESEVKKPVSDADIESESEAKEPVSDTESEAKEPVSDAYTETESEAKESVSDTESSKESEPDIDSAPTSDTEAEADHESSDDEMTRAQKATSFGEVFMTPLSLSNMFKNKPLHFGSSFEKTSKHGLISTDLFDNLQTNFFESLI